MARLSMYWAYATRSLMRAGQRGVLAIGCVAVGVMAIVALRLVANNIGQAITSNIVAANGGDIRVIAFDAIPLHNNDLTYLAQLQADGRITGFAATYEAEGDSNTADGADITYTLIAIPGNYPLVGDANFVDPSGAHLRTIVHADQAAFDQNVVTQLHAHLGDSVLIKLRDGRALTVHIAGIFKSSGGFAAQQVYVAQSLLNAAPGPSGNTLPPSYSTLYLTVPSSEVTGVAHALQAQLPTTRVITVADLLRQRQKQVQLIQLFLQVVGLLALFIGGIGIVNTMQVMMRRRTTEIAMLKTSGYREYDLLALFGLEAGLVGLLGGVVGSALGTAISAIVRIVVEHAFFLQLPATLDPRTILSGVGIGLATALIFGLLPIIQGSRVRPLAILRDYAEGYAPMSRAANAGLLLLLSLLFVALAGSILGSVAIAALVVYGGALLIALLGWGFNIFIRGIARLPIFERPTVRILPSLALAVAIAAAGCAAVVGLFLVAVRLGGNDGSFTSIVALVFIAGPGVMLGCLTVVYALAALLNAVLLFAPRSWKMTFMFAYRNVGRTPGRTTATMTALFVGIFGIGMVVVMGQGIKDTITTTLASLTQYNVFVIVAPNLAASTQSAISDNPALSPKTMIQATVGSVIPSVVGPLQGPALLAQLRQSDDLSSLTSIEGFDLSAGAPVVQLQSGRNLQSRDSGTNDTVISGYLSLPPYNVRIGDLITIAGSNELQYSLRVIGFYGTGATGNANFGGILTDIAIANTIAGPNHLTVFSLKMDPASVPALRRQIVQSVPAAIVFSLVDLTAIIDQILTDIMILLTTLASLALLSGLVIIANAVALAMLERRREIGILKTVGHQSWSILAMIIIENGLVALLSALIALLLVVGGVVIFGTQVLHITLIINVTLVVAILCAAVAVTVAVATAVAWGATRIRPIEVLRYE